MLARPPLTFTFRQLGKNPKCSTHVLDASQFYIYNRSFHCFIPSVPKEPNPENQSLGLGFFLRTKGVDRKAPVYQEHEKTNKHTVTILLSSASAW